VVNTISLTFATAWLLSLGGLAVLMSAVLVSVAELLVLGGPRSWGTRDVRSPELQVVRPGVGRYPARALVARVIAQENRLDGSREISVDERGGRPRAAA
jgi:hypothetical protein